MPGSCRQNTFDRTRKGVHSAGCPPFEVAATYPFHPFANRTVLVAGATEHAGTRHLIIREADGSAVLLPVWMTAPEAALVRIVDRLRLPVDRLVDLRTIVDGLMVSSSGDLVPTGGHGHEEIDDAAAELVRADAASERSAIAQRASALELLRVLLTEAMLDPAIGIDVPAREEIGDDQDHA
jgi:hypothetical protein